MIMKKSILTLTLILFLTLPLTGTGFIAFNAGGAYLPENSVTLIFPRADLEFALDGNWFLDRSWSFFSILTGDMHFKPLDGLLGYNYLAKAYFSYAAPGFILIPALMSTGERADNTDLGWPGYSKHQFSLELGFDLLGISCQVKPSLIWQVDELILAGEWENVFELGDFINMGIILQAEKTLIFQNDNYSFSSLLNFSFYQFEPFLIDLQFSGLYNNSGYSQVVFEGDPAIELFDYWDIAASIIIAAYVRDVIITLYLPVTLRLNEHPVIWEDGLGPESAWQLSLEPDITLTLYWIMQSAWICDLKFRKVLSNSPAARSLEVDFSVSFKLSF